jgi:endonuclease VIII
MPEGDTIRWQAGRIRPALEGRAPEMVRTHPRFGADRWVERLTGRPVQRVDAYGKHLMVRFDGELVLHSHLGMVGSWGVYAPERRWPRSPRRAWLVMRVEGVDVVQFDGSTLELLSAGRARFDQRLAGLGPDILAEEFDAAECLRRLRGDDPTRPIGDALLDQRTLAGIGNMWKAEGCWDAQIDPWRATREVSDEEVLRVVTGLRPRMQDSVIHGPRSIHPRVYGRAGRPCPRCGETVRSRGQVDDNRSTYWCPGCQR